MATSTSSLDGRRRRRRIGFPGLHFHDLRHSREHSRCADRREAAGPHDAHGARQPSGWIYQHATAEADQAIASAISAVVEELRRAREQAEPQCDAEEAAGSDGDHDPDDGAAGVFARAG